MRNFSVCRADYQISSTHTVGTAADREQRQQGTPQYNRTAASKTPEQQPGLCQAKHTHTHTLRFILMSFRLKSSYLRLQHTGPEQSREEGMDCWAGHAQNDNGTRHYRHFTLGKQQKELLRARLKFSQLNSAEQQFLIEILKAL